MLCILIRDKSTLVFNYSILYGIMLVCFTLDSLEAVFPLGREAPLNQLHNLTYSKRYCALRRRSALPITDTELKLMAAAAKMGLSRIPKKG
jgi:hypothetical protein